MDIRFNFVDKTLKAYIIGEIDHHSASFFREKLDDEIKDRSAKNLILDFSQVSFMDSSGIGMIIGRYKNINSIGGYVSICNMSDNILKIFNISGLGKIIKVGE